MTYGADAFVFEYGLTTEQRAQCEAYAVMLLETQAHTNLIGAATLPELWRRHFADSAQLKPHGATTSRWLDIGSGAGFPGVVLAILGETVELVEARRKKASFLERTVERLGLAGRARVHAERIEALAPFEAATITARALAPVAQLFDWGLRFAAQETRWVLPKGASVEAELSEARLRFRFEHRLVQSRTAAEGRIMVANGIARVFHVEHRPKRRK